MIMENVNLNFSKDLADYSHPIGKHVCTTQNGKRMGTIYVD